MATAAAALPTAASGGTTGTRRTNVRSARAAHGGGASSGLSMASWLGLGGMGRGGGGVGHVQAAIVDDAGRVVVAARDAHGLAAHGLAALLLALLAACRGVGLSYAATLQRCVLSVAPLHWCMAHAARCNGVVHVATVRDVYCTLHAALPFAALPRAPPAQRRQRACAVASACSTSEHNSRGATPHRHAACRVVASLNRGLVCLTSHGGHCSSL